MAEPLTDERLAAIETRCAAATPGPWRPDLSEQWECNCEAACQSRRDEAETRGEDDGCTCEHPMAISGAWVDGPVLVEFEDDKCSFTNNDVMLMAHARQDVPDLVAEVRRLRAFIEGLMGDECTAFDNYLTGGPGSCPESDWARDQWCLHCRSRVALAGDKA